jgi:N-acetylmuramoyl-L-alanine amidase
MNWFAYQLQEVFKSKLGFESRGVKFANFQVLRETIAFCNSILLELGFLSNEDEAVYYQKLEALKVLALVIWESLIKKLESYERIGN